MSTETKRGRPIHYNHGKCRNLVNGLAIESEAVRMQALNLIERAAQYWFEAAWGDPEEFEEWYNQRTK